MINKTRTHMHIDLTVLLYHHAPNNYIQWVTLNIMPRLAFFPSVHSMQWVTWYNLYRPAWWVLCSTWVTWYSIQACPYQDVLCEVRPLLGTTATYACLFRQMWITQVSVLKIDKQTFPAETRCSEACRDSQLHRRYWILLVTNISEIAEGQRLSATVLQ